MTSTDIRAIESYEVPLLVPQAREFFKEAPIAGAFNEGHFVAQLEQHVKDKRALVLAAGVPFRGAIGGILFQDLATGESCCMEYFWYVAKEERGSLGIRLLDEFERRIKALAVKRIMMMHLVSPRSDKFQDIYERRGYALKERVFVKELQ